MRKLLLLFVISFIFQSCSNESLYIEENGQQDKSLSNRTEPECTIAQVGNSTMQYNCFGLAFSVSEFGTNLWIDDPTQIYNTYITSGLFKESSGSDASKVLYWHGQSDFEAKNPSGISHAAIIISGNGPGSTVWSKEGGGVLRRNCINYNYLDPNDNNRYRTYALDLTLSHPPVSAPPVRNSTFTLSAPADGSQLGVSYNWVINPSSINKVEKISDDGYTATFHVLPNAPYGNVSICLNAVHQTGEIAYGTNGNSYATYAKNLSSCYSFNLVDPNPPYVPLTASFSGSNYVTAASMGTWNATANGGTPGYTYTWWIKRSDGTGGAAYMIGGGTTLVLMTTTSKKPIYYDLYLKVTDSVGASYTTTVKVITATGTLENAI